MADAQIGSTPQRHSSASVDPDRSQSALKELLQLELKDLVFESADVPELFFVRSRALDRCIPSWSSEKLQELIEALIQQKVKEESYYGPLVALLNAITASRQIPSQTAPTRVLFRVYDKQMRDRLDGLGKLKPDVLGTDKEYPTNASVLWRDVWIAVEVKELTSDGLRQAMTYARSMLEAGNKWFAMVLFFRPLSASLRFCFVTRHGVFMTPAWDVQKKMDFEAAASTLLHACYATTATSADPYRRFGASGGLEFNIPSLGRLPRVRELFHRIHIVGRATHVYLASSVTLGPTSSPNNKALDDETVLVQKLEAPVPGRQIETPAAPYGQSTRTLRSSTKAANQAAQQAAQQAALQQAQQTAQQSSPATQQSAVSSASAALLPTLSSNALAEWRALCHTPQDYFRRVAEKYVIKEAWVLYDRLQVEVDVLSAVDGAYACPQLAGYTTVPHPAMGKLAFFGSAVSSSSKKWRCRDWSDVYSSPETGPYFAPRVHRLIYYTTHGIQLESIAEDGFAFAHAVKDGLIALYILFWHKYLHRDVSTGNILALSSPTYHAETEIKAMDWYKSDARFAKYMTLLKKQCAFVSDFDQAVKWDEDRKHVSARSGTLACLSTKRLYAWSTGASAVDTLIDDLEAIIWTFLFVLLKYHSERNGLSELEAEHFEALKGDNLYHMLGTKHLILNLDDDAADDHDALKPTWPLWLRLFAAARIARSKLKEVVNLAQGVAYSEMTPALKQRYEGTCVDAVFLYLDAVKDAIEDQAFNRQPQPQPVDTVQDDKDVFGSTS